MMVTYEAKTTSLPHGEIEAEPTGLSRSNEPFWPNVGLSKAEAGPLNFSDSVITHELVYVQGLY